jgi:hypothetical protein
VAVFLSCFQGSRVGKGDRFEKGIQDVEGAPIPLVPVFLVCFQGGRVDKGDGFPAKAHENLKELELDGMGFGGQTH